MFKINEDGSLYVTRGDTCTISVSANVKGVPHRFKAGDVLRIKVYERKACHCVVLQKDFATLAETETVDLVLTERDTRIGSLINKPVDYWYEIELNPLTSPQTIVGYDDDGPKLFRLFPEAADNEVIDVPEPEEIPPVDLELDLLSTRPVSNQAATRGILEVKEAREQGDQQNAEAIQKNAESIGKNAYAIQRNKGLIDEHKKDKDNPHGVTKEQLGLGNVDNTSDLEKPLSTAQAEAIRNLRNQLTEHSNSQENPHGVTAAQLGLDRVNNTSDMEKPVSTAQAEAIADAKQAGTDAQTQAKQAVTVAESAKEVVDDAKAVADSARTIANEAKTAAQNAQSEAARKTAWFTKTVTLSSGGWSSYEQTVSIPGVTDDKSQPIIIVPATPEAFYEYSTYGVKPSRQGADALTFSCEYTPTADIRLDVLGFTVPA